MDWYKGFMLVIGVVAAVRFPISLFRAVSRRQTARVFEVIANVGVLAYLVAQALSPALLRPLGPAAGWLFLGLAVLCFANSFGLSRRLFPPRNAGGSPRSV